MDKVYRKKLSAGAFAVIQNGKEIGRYGGREGRKWAETADGKTITEDSPLSVKTLIGLIVNYNP